MIELEEIKESELNDFWNHHYEYLINNEIIKDEEDKEYFRSDEYRLTIKEHMFRKEDKHHIMYFVEEGIRIGAVSYCIYHSEDGKCFILDFWLFPDFRRKGNGTESFVVFEKHANKEGALYYEINCDGRSDRMRFWKKNGFVENGTDEYGEALYTKGRT